MAIWDKVKQELDRAGRAAQDAIDDGKVRLDGFRARQLADKAAQALGYAVYRARREGRIDDGAALDHLHAELARHDAEATRLEAHGDAPAAASDVTGNAGAATHDRSAAPTPPAAAAPPAPATAPAAPTPPSRPTAATADAWHAGSPTPTEPPPVRHPLEAPSGPAPASSGTLDAPTAPAAPPTPPALGGDMTVDPWRPGGPADAPGGGSPGGGTAPGGEPPRAW